MFRVLLLLFVGLLSASPAPAQHRLSRTVLQSLPAPELPRQDNAALLHREEQVRRPGRPRDFAVALPVHLSPGTDGKWSTDRGRAIWHLRISSPGAKSLNLGFTDFRLPEGAQLYLSTADNRFGPFTAADNEDHAQFWSPLLAGDELVIELRMPTTERTGVGLVLTTVNHDFTGVIDEISGSCNLDVICGGADGFPLIDNYRDIIRSVAAYTLNGKSQCTGFLVNNTNQDGRPLFLTAEHCAVDAESAPSLVAYWNFENSWCRAPNSVESGQPGDGKLDVFNTGARVRARYSATDMVLLELDEPVNPLANAFFAGWSNESAAPTDGVLTVHHPNIEEKRISYSYRETTVSNIIGDSLYSGGDFLRVPSWDVGTTQGGSSGAPLFGTDGLARGQLFGGRASCTKDGDDMFGFLHRSWTGGGTPSSRLADWLDPLHSGTPTQEGLEQSDLPYLVVPETPNLTRCVTDSAVFVLRVGDGFPESNRVSISADPGLTLLAADSVSGGGLLRIVYRGRETPAQAGEHTIQVTVSGGGVTDEVSLRLRLLGGVPAPAVPQYPVDGGDDVGPFARFSWSAQEQSAGYDLQLSNDPSFTLLVADLTRIEDTSYLVRYPLVASTGYYWRVRANNSCGAGEWSPAYLFKTSDLSCITGSAVDLPVEIPTLDSVRIFSQLEINSSTILSSLEVTVGLEHTFIGDVYADLVAPDGTVISLFRPLQNGLCSNSDLYVTFADDAPVTATQFREDCDPGTFGNYRRVQPTRPLSDLAGTPVRGTWQLIVTDRAGGDGGRITEFGLRICGEHTGKGDLAVGILSSPTARCVSTGGTAQLQLAGEFTDLDLRIAADNLLLDNYTYSLDTPTNVLTVNFADWMSVGPGTFDLSFIVTDEDGTERHAVTTLALLPTPEPALPLATRIDTSRVTFQWRTSAEASGYTLEVAASEDFADIILSRYTLGSELAVERRELPDRFFYRLVATNACGSSPGAARFIVLEEPSSSTSFTARDIAVYPNPTHGLLNVELVDEWQRQPLTFTLFDAAGRPVREWEGQGYALRQLELGGNSPGVYYLRIAGVDGIFTKRVLLLR
ncbi:subtilisin-like proprotein convertase family protein [Lewinella aquimaris]|uniref:Subtilisin-like proprotein convertase family protein n=1 Tax=Neolewinella aquimaris TaxID=1835722 RepID=A0A840ED99_9BACT|nr:proprotein convertase P-domain-containing protein [Neolewinella aquimaris]MBB4078916.1 subtilisin-like proprotein convertase family protein [Neolewinella aquimaris]